jgi:chromosome segregation ATPase
MSKRDEYIARMRAQLDEWTADLHKLEAKAGSLEADVADRYRHAIAELRDKRDEAEAKLENIRHAGEETWEELRDEAEKTWTAFRAGLDVFRDFSDHS